MKTTMWKIWMLIAMLGTLAIVGCNKDDDSSNNNNSNDDETIMGDGTGIYEYGIPSATIEYKYITYKNVLGREVTQEVLIFDNYGNRFRYERYDSAKTILKTTVIYDKKVGKSYFVLHEEKEYYEVSMLWALGNCSEFMYLGDQEGNSWSIAFSNTYHKKDNKMVIGKDCTMCGYNFDENTTVEWAGWKKITFWMYDVNTNGNFTKIEATSFSENIPDKNFAPPSDYTHKGFL